MTLRDILHLLPVAAVIIAALLIALTSGSGTPPDAHA